jgi:hypothetical protein
LLANFDISLDGLRGELKKLGKTSGFALEP